MSLPVPRSLARDELSGDWSKDVDTLSDSLGDFQDATVQTINGNLTSKNTTSGHGEYDLVHGIETRIKSPIAARVLGIQAVGCVGVRVDSSGKPTRELYALDMPVISWRYGTEGLIVKATYPQTTGLIGERVSSFLPVASAVTLVGSPAAAKTITSISLTAGTWDASGIVQLNGDLTGDDFIGAISATTNSIGSSTTQGDQRVESPTMSTAVADTHVSIPDFRITVTATTVYYLVGYAAFTVGTGKAYGRISAVRAVKADAALRGRVRLYFFGG